MNKFLTMLFALMLTLSGCLGGEDVIENEEPQPVLLDTDGDGTPDVDDDDDDNDSWTDVQELNCDSDTLLASSVPDDADGDGNCDVLDSDKDGDGKSNINEEVCGSNPLDATSIPADLDADGTCDALDDDMDGDGVANADDFAPENPDKSEGKGGCVDASAFNYDETAEVDDASCLTLEDAEEAVAAAMAGIVSSETTGATENMIIQTTMVIDAVDGKSSLSMAMLGEDGELLYQATYVDDGTGFVEVELYMTPDEGGSPMIEQYKVNGAYFVANTGEDSGWSHCEYDGTNWYCTDIGMNGDMLYNSDSETETYHQYTCANGETVFLSQVNDGNEDCMDGSDEPNIQSDGKEFLCYDGSTIYFYLANDGSADCADGSDEDNFIDEFICPDGTVLPGDYINDGYEDCMDGSDEPVYDMSSHETSVYTCEDGSEVPLSSVNDDVEDCADGTDENPTGGTSTELFGFICGGGTFWDDEDEDEDEDSEEIPLSMVNDGSEDCDDGSDEPAYDANGAEINYYNCYNFQTESTTELNISQVNDGTVDCDLRMDESAASGNYTERWFGLDNDEEYTGECQMNGDYFMIPWSWVNDGIDDCDNGMDEPFYDLTGAEDSVITCYDDSEIALSLANDGTDDCAEGEDEITWELISSYTCADGEMGEFDWLNDGEEDCEDGSDEPTYDLEELTDFECDDDTLIPFSHVNDGSDDCANAEDEPDIQEIEYTTFECASGDEIPLSYVNDGEEDCPAGDDEPSYAPITQNEVSTYTCKFSGETIGLSLVNDGTEDCEDATDEPQYYGEDLNEMECADGSDTIPISWANDGGDDCADGSDEAQYEIPEDESVFYCADGSEIAVSQFNDGVVDCGDGSDEPATFMCDDGSDEIPFAYVNDGWVDCDDESDESVIEDMSVADCYGSEDGSTLTASQFRDGDSDCASDWEDSWDEMEFELTTDCEWTGDDTGWVCTDVAFPADATYEMWMLTDENGLEMIGLNSTLSDGEVMMAMFDAATHAFLMLEETSYDEDGNLEEHMLIKSVLYDSTIADALVVDTSLDTHAPPFAVVFDGLVGEGHGYGDYTFTSTGIADWTMGADDDMLEIVFAMCDTFEETETAFERYSYLIPSDCGDELARYTMAEIMNGDIAGLELVDLDEEMNPENEFVLFIDEEFELEEWNTVRLSTPDGEYADENPQVQLPASGIGFALIAMLGAAMLASRRNV